MRDLEYELIGSTQYLNKSRACENLRFYFSSIYQQQNKILSWTENIFLEGIEEEEEHEKE